MVSSTTQQLGFIEEIMHGAARWVEKVTQGAHSAPVANAVGVNTVPSRHRLYNAAGGIGLWIAGRYIMNIMVGETPNGKKVEKDKVPEPLRPLHGILAYNRYADDPHNQWMRVIDDLTPAIIGSVGAVLGSKYFFTAKEQGYLDAVGWGTRNKTVEAVMADESISMLAKDSFKSMQQAKTWRVMSGIDGVFSASSGMALAVLPINWLNYGNALNIAFAEMNGVTPGSQLYNNKLLRWIFNTVANTSHSPAPAAEALINNVSNCVIEMEQIAKRTGVKLTAEAINNMNDGRIHVFTEAIVKKFFSNIPEAEVKAFEQGVKDAITEAVQKREIAENVYARTIAINPKASAKGLAKPAAIAEYVHKELASILSGKDKAIDNFIGTLAVKHKSFAQKPTFANNGFAGWLGNHPGVAYGSVAGAAAMGIAATAVSGEAKHPARNLLKSADPNAKEKDKGFVNGPLLRFGRWLGDSVINVPPQNRLFSAVGLSLGLWAGYRGMRSLAGKDFNGAALAKNAKIDPILKWCTDSMKRIGLKLDFNYFVTSHDQTIKRAIFWGVPTLTGLLGVYWGSKFAFRKQYKELANPEYLEDYTAKIALTQGDKWSILSATAGSMASASGFASLPIPGLNYSIGLSTRSTLSYDKKTTMPGLKWWSNNKSSYYFGLKGALEFTIRYAVRNPSENPVELVGLAEATLKPIFPDVTNEQIARYVDKIQAVRTKHMSLGGIPQEKQADAEKELRGMLRGAGFEKTLEEIGLNPGKAVFDNGVSGKIANFIGAKKPVAKLEKDYRAKYEKRSKKTDEQPAQEAPAIPAKPEIDERDHPRFAENERAKKPHERVTPAANHVEHIQLAAEQAALAGAHGRI